MESVKGVATELEDGTLTISKVISQMYFTHWEGLGVCGCGSNGIPKLCNSRNHYSNAVPCRCRKKGCQQALEATGLMP